MQKQQQRRQPSVVFSVLRFLLAIVRVTPVTPCHRIHQSSVIGHQFTSLRGLRSSKQLIRSL
ncbi:hypothetical protein PR003_g24924 [Phytophthora rubi]|uniref:Secreted protein n=1 Tax=Phytophthora rubi TaxID=129364 RepID=A0A6A3IHP2_9STRA|nr:hypothetical protein PR002_g24471 [Phytophthora rubi]KAE9036018.1 hypothetical protein PR001_g9037 [Phytophthora rubi]KAE9291816.1 hypothetical protein PR003_g24924 [Phytophthora rubi]